MRAAILLLLAAPLPAATYQVDCSSPSGEWNNLEKISNTTFAPGDAILFRRGTRCKGMLWPKGSGEEGRPIRIGAYGEGPLPIIDGGASQAAIRLFNQGHWGIETIETTGGSPYGIYIGADEGRWRHFRITNAVVHDVTGEVKAKASGLVVVHAGAKATLEDVLIDGVTAYNTTQWAGVIVQGGSRENRARNVIVRNTIVHDVFGDGIILFQVENGLIEKSAAWLTGLQPTQTIGTPNGIWTWRCRNCTVQLCEGFYIDSPGVDGGVFDIDWGNDDNTVQDSYGHDAQGYCVSVFGARNEGSTNSVIRHNVCVNNGRSPKLARRQGDIYLSTWAGGALDGVLIHDNHIYWNPPIDAPAVESEQVSFTGTRPNVFRNNIIYSRVPSLIRSAAGLAFEGNVYWYEGSASPRWIHGGSVSNRPGAADSFARPRPEVFLGGPAPPPRRAPEFARKLLRKDRWLLLLQGAEARSQLVFVQAALAQYGDSKLDAALVGEEKLRHDWNLGQVRVVPGSGAALLLVSPSGQVVREWPGFAPPAELGVTLRLHLGPPAGAPALVL